MNNDINRLVSARKSFLAALNDPQADTPLLRSMVKEMKATQADLLVPYLADDNYDPIQANALAWNDAYFSQQKKYAERNFSVERLEHLIQVRERFRQDGRKGFVAKPQAAPAAPRVEASIGYIPSTNLRNFVEEGDLSTVRTALSVDLEDSRLDSQTLRSALAWAKARLPDLCEPYKEKAFSRAIENDAQQWTRDYYEKQLVYLDTNFTEERFLHLIGIREHLRQQGVAKPAPAPAAAAARPAADERREAPHASRPAPAPNRHGLSPVLLAAMLLGGALAAVAILILVLQK